MIPSCLPRRRSWLGACVAALVALMLVPPAAAGGERIRFATFNASLNRNFEGQLIADLSTPANGHAPWRRSSSAHARRCC